MRGLRTGAAAVVMCAAISGGSVNAQRPSVHCYTEGDGLVQNSIVTAYQDRRGFLWIGTLEGLSRFDGRRFVSYGAADGLENLFVSQVTEDPDGRLWVATLGGGIARLVDDPGPSAGFASQHAPARKFVTIRIAASPPEANAVNSLVFDRRGIPWVATNNGVYRGRPAGDGDWHFEAVPAVGRGVMTAGYADRQGRLWFWLSTAGVVAVRDDQIVRFEEPEQMAAGRPVADAFDESPDGTLRLALSSGVFEYVEAPHGVWPGRWTPAELQLRDDERLAGARTDSAGRLWIGTGEGRLFVSDLAPPRQAVTVPDLGRGRLTPLLEDRNRNVWVATQASLCRVSTAPILTYTTGEGLPSPVVLGLFEGSDGRIYASTEAGIVEVGDGHILPVAGADRGPYLRLGRRALQSRSGDWWVALENDLIRFRGPRLQFRDEVARVPAARLPGGALTDPGTVRTPGLYEDPSGRLMVPTTDGGIYWLSAGGTRAVALDVLERLDATEGLIPRLTPGAASGDGTVWLASMTALARVRHGRIELVTPGPGLPDTNVRSLYFDRQGRLWIGLRTSGVSMTLDPSRDNLEFVNYSTADGLSSEAVWSIAEDDEGRLYFATNRGLNRLDPATGRIRHFTMADGLPGSYITYCLRDRRGYVWIGTTNGLARFDVRAEGPPHDPPPVFVTRIEIAGASVHAFERGIQQTTVDRLPAVGSSILIEYAGLSLGREHTFRYQYRLHGASGEWSAPSEARAVTYAQLGPGRFRFEVRAVDWNDRTGPPAVVFLEILPPLWQRWWFVAGASLLATALALLLHRLHLRQAVAMERVRRQVATDLHDDVGAGLSEISILSEVAKRDPGAAPLDEIAGLARRLRESMDDIVWAVDPRSDRLATLAERIRQAAFNSLESDGRTVELRMPDEHDLARINLDAAMRRHLLLIAKEAITNIARHADAARVAITMEIVEGELRLTIRDDGRGFSARGTCDGQGLRSMARRAAELGGDLVIDSGPGRGTLVAVRIRLR